MSFGFSDFGSSLKGAMSIIGDTARTSSLRLNLSSALNSIGLNLSTNLSTHKKSSGARIKGYIMDSTLKNRLKFQYNPQSMEYSRGVNYAEVVSPGMQYPLTYFVNGGSKTFELELFEYDRPSTGRIRKDIEFLEGLMPKMTNTQGYFINPNACIVAYGGDVAKCVVTGLRTHIDEYAQDGEPYMAHLTVSLKVIDIPFDKKVGGKKVFYDNNRAEKG